MPTFTAAVRRRIAALSAQTGPTNAKLTGGTGPEPEPVVAVAAAQRLQAQRLSGKVCIVTGGSSGIGRAVCERLAREGAKLVILDTRRAPREGGATVLECAAAARAEEGLPAVEDAFVQGSVADAASAAAAVKTALSSFGRLDVLVNNAALLASNPLLETSEEEWDEFMTVNAKGALPICALGRMPRRLCESCSACRHVLVHQSCGSPVFTAVATRCGWYSRARGEHIKPAWHVVQPRLTRIWCVQGSCGVHDAPDCC